MKKSIVLKFSIFIFTALFLFSCSEENETPVIQQDAMEDATLERKFKYEKCMELKDGEFTITYCVQSDIEEEIDKVIRQNPAISVSPYSTHSVDISENLLKKPNENDGIIHETIYDVAEVIKESNIPSGYMLEIYYEKSNVEKTNKASLSTRYFTNSGAKGISVNATQYYSVACSFYSKGCCWYSTSSWYDRGYRNIGYENTDSHTFHTSSYTSYYGARMTSYTTIQNWNSLQKYFIY